VGAKVVAASYPRRPGQVFKVVTFWDRFTKRQESPAPAAPEDAAPRRAPEVAPPPPAEPTALTRLLRAGAADGPTSDEAVALFRSLRASADEARAIDAVRSAASARAIPEPLRVVAAAALAERGEPDSALSLVSPPSGGCSSPEARVLAADLRAERGEVPEALALIERVLVHDLDYPGARERHTRWRTLLGIDANPVARPDTSATTVVSREPDSPFLLLREVARGGAGAVYEAEDRELLRRVALKVYHHPERDRAQLMHEARVAASLAGGGIVRVLDLDPDHGWLALEWAPLGSLRQHIRATNAALLAPIGRWAFPLASAIARVHAAGWVHHDVKPANVLLASPERPILADFGSARRAGEPSPPGSLGYLSPERLSGRASDPRDDIFGFGRIVEDVLATLSAQGTRGEPSTPHSQGAGAGWTEIAAACTGPDGGRPSDARALLTRLRVEVRSF
jgi:eukaryotic-like serine/threonine-protein kinase